MSFKPNEKDLRAVSGIATETSQGIKGGAAFQDATGLFPRPDYFNSTNVSYAAVGSKRNDLALYATAPDVDFNLGSPVASEYPYNQSRESVSGHVVEIDDTPGNERILIKHNQKFGIELRPDGSILITSKQNKSESIGGDLTIVVEGDANLVYKGNLNTTVNGDYNLNVKGDVNVDVGGNKVQTIAGSDRRSVSGSVGTIVTGGYSVTANQQATMTYLGGMSQNVKGVFSNNVDGSANYVSSGGAVFTSESRIDMASADINIAAASTSVFGATGTFGGAGVVFYGKGGTFSEGVTAETFHGDLDGLAKEASSSYSQTYADPAGGGGVGSNNWGSAGTNVATPTTALPTSTNIASYLSRAAGGIRKVKIDVGDFIRNFIDKTVATGGVSSKPLTTSAARSKMRDPANRSNSAFVGEMISNQTICIDYNNPTPPGIGRVISGGAVPEDGETPIGNGSIVRRSFKPSESNVDLAPDRQYNPDYVGEITSSTKLAPGITIAKFLGSDDPTNINFVKSVEERKKIARYYYVHAQIMKSLQLDTDKFKDYTLVVAEGLYRPGPQETVTPGSINDLKQKGRAVVYNLVDRTGRSDPTTMFDLAAYWKSKIYYDRMILSYDTIDCQLNARLVVVLPELDANWNGTVTRTVETEFNGVKLSQGELVEVLQSASIGSGGYGASDGSSSSSFAYSGSGQIIANPSMNPIFTMNGQQSRFTKPDAGDIMMNDTIPRVKKLAELFGRPLIINDAIAKSGTSRESTTVGSQHFYGRAVDISTTGMSNSDKLRLVDLALQVGFTGFGFGNTILHIDTGSRRGWGYGNATYGGVSVESLDRKVSNYA